jgi:pyruvate carboxylase
VALSTNLTFLEAIMLKSPGIPQQHLHDAVHRFDAGTVRAFKSAATRATKLLTYLADVTVNGHPETLGRPKPPAD